MPAPQTFDVVILGAGAAGLMCALVAGKRGRRVALLDHADRPGKKILISGGGRSNFTNRHTRPEHFLSENPHFAKSALARFTPSDMIALVEKHGISFHEKTLGQLFCDRSAHDLVTLLERECAEAHVTTFLGTRIAEIRTALRDQSPTRFLIETSRGPFHARSLIVATGGLSIPKMGATGLGYTLAEQFGLRLVPCRPGLVPLVFNPEDQARWSDLTGLSVEVTAAPTGTLNRTARTAVPAATVHMSLSRNSHIPGAVLRKPVFREKMLLTHRGLSGPAILQASSFWRPGEPLSLDLAPGRTVIAPLLAPNGRREPTAALDALRAVFPARLAERWLDLHHPANWKNPSLALLERQLHDWQVTPAGTEGYAKAEVTAGGVDTRDLDARTLESRAVPGLFFIGEVVDVTGWLGGYNFQWAWASGFSAGQVA